MILFLGLKIYLFIKGFFMRFSYIASVVGLVLLSALASAEQSKIEKALAAALPQLIVSAVSESKIPGVYRVTDQRGQVIFASADGAYFLTGELYSTKGGELVNLSERERQGQRLEELAGLEEGDKITFPAKGEEKARVTVFTDIDCGYCRKLHGEVPRMNELGISVSYLAFPRAGVGSPSYDKLVNVWCSDDRLDAMTQAKAGKVVPKKSCANPVAAEYNLGNKLGVSGTPAIVLGDGALVPGYVPAEQLAQGLGLLN